MSPLNAITPSRAFEAIAEAHPALAERVGKIEPVAVVDNLRGDAPVGALAHRARQDVGGLRWLPRHVARFVDAELDVLVVDLMDQRIDDAPGFRRPEQAKRPGATHQPRRQDHIVQFADVVVVVVGDQHRIDPRQRNVQRGELPHHATAGIDQDGVIAGLDQQ